MHLSHHIDVPQEEVPGSSPSPSELSAGTTASSPTTDRSSMGALTVSPAAFTSAVESTYPVTTELVTFKMTNYPSTTYPVTSYSPSTSPRNNKVNDPVPIIVGLSVGTLILSVVLGIFFFFVRKRRQNDLTDVPNLPVSNPDASQLKAVTGRSDFASSTANEYGVSDQEQKDGVPKAKEILRKALRIAELP